MNDLLIMKKIINSFFDPSKNYFLKSSKGFYLRLRAASNVLENSQFYLDCYWIVWVEYHVS